MVRSDQILTVAQMRDAEQALIDGGQTIESLMETAGCGVADLVWRMAAHRPVTILCGPGNNGGDGYVAARELLRRGGDVTIVAPCNPSTPAAIAARASYSGPVAANGKRGLLVDCLFGSGLTRPLEPEMAAQLRSLAESHALRVAVDMPSGIESDHGRVLNEGLPDYDLTIALGAWKFAHWLMPGMAGMGERRLVDIGAGPVTRAAGLIARPQLLAPQMDAYKYSRGLVAVVGGVMPGAASLAARAAMRGGAGYVKLLADQRPAPVPDDLVVETGALSAVLSDQRIAALLLGPGLGGGAEVAGKLAAVLERGLPTVLDADAIRLLVPAMVAGREAPLVLTPHAGELEALVQNFVIAARSRVEQVRALAREAGAVIIAKGPDTLVADPSGALHIARPAPSWLATAGSGDVLAGLVASRLATGRTALEAACEAVWLHGEAARLSGPAFTVGDLINAIPDAYKACL